MKHINNLFRKLKRQETAGLTIIGSVFVALALIVIFGLVVGTSFNEIKDGLGNLSLGFAAIAFVVLIIISIFKN